MKWFFLHIFELSLLLFVLAIIEPAGRFEIQRIYSAFIIALCFLLLIILLIGKHKHVTATFWWPFLLIVASVTISAMQIFSC